MAGLMEMIILGQIQQSITLILTGEAAKITPKDHMKIVILRDANTSSQLGALFPSDNVTKPSQKFTPGHHVTKIDGWNFNIFDCCICFIDF